MLSRNGKHSLKKYSYAIMTTIINRNVNKKVNINVMTEGFELSYLQTYFGAADKSTLLGLY